MKTAAPLKLMLLLILCLSGMLSKAAFLKNIPLRLEQPDGTRIQVYMTGDEYYNWLHDANNFTIVKNPLTAYYVYANLKDDILIPSIYVVGLNNPVTSGLKAGINIPSWKMEQIRKGQLQSVPRKFSSKSNKSLLSNTISGTLNNIVVFIRFNDQDEFTDPVTVYDDMFNNNIEGANSMFNYFKDVSYNSMFVPSTFYPLPDGTLIISYQDSHARDYYLPFDSTSNLNGYTPDQKTSREHTLLKNAVEAISSQVPAGINIDFDNDNYVDNICFIIKGTTSAWNTLLWPHRSALYSQSCFINGKRVWDYNLQVETFLASSGVGVLAHEMMHTFGCPDLYHYNGDGFSPVGPWDLMDGNTNPPQHIGAFMKKKYTGWITSIPTLTTPGTYTLNPLVNGSNCAYRLNSPNETSEYFILEYRKKDGIFEGALPASGLLIYRINTVAGDGNSDGPPDEVYLYRPGGTDTTNGDVYSGYFSLASGRTSFSDFTNPNDWLTDGITLGGISIINITAADNTISFTVNMNTLADFTADITTTCPDATVSFLDQSVGSPNSWNWSFSPNTIVFVEGTTASSQHPRVQFTATGNYSVTLTANGPNGQSTVTKNNFINILASFAPPLTENFETGSFITNNWTILNPDGTKTWEIFNGTGGNTGTKSAYVNFYNYPSYPAIDDLVAIPLSLPATGTATLTFKVAYRQYDETYHDSLKVLLSTNCGSTYPNLLYNKGDATLATASPQTTFFVPSTPAEWRTETIDLTPFMGQAVTVKFRAVNGYGNNLYIDEIQLIREYHSLQGNINYLNEALTPMSNTTVALKQGSTTVYSTTTDNQGHYSFGELAPGTYKVVPATSKPWGGVNSSDALLIMKHYVGMNYLSGLPLKAANVDNIPAVNAVDAFVVQRRVVGLLTSFPVGNWVFDNPTLLITDGTPITRQLNALTTGDVNASYTPAVKLEDRIDINTLGYGFFDGKGKLDIPVSSDISLNIGAITCYLDYPAENMKLTGISMGDNRNENLVYTDFNGKISVSWASIEPLLAGTQNPLFTLHFEILNSISGGALLKVVPGGEFADPNGEPYESVMLLQPSIILSEDAVTALNIYPDPVSDVSTISFTLPVNDKADISVYNSSGQKVMTIVQRDFPAGKHEISWDGKNDHGHKLETGVYYLRMLTTYGIKVLPVLISP